jgi:hypothetical protein
MGERAFWRSALAKLNKYAGNLPKNAAVFILAGTVIGYWNSYEDKVADRHERAWSVVREAMDWSKNGWGGNIGQNNAIEILTRDCHGWSTAPPFSYFLSFFFSDCIPLRSLALKSMDFRLLKAPGSDLSDSFLACSNFGAADLRWTSLRNTRFHAADLTEADFSNANLDSTCFYKANVAGAIFNGVRNFDPASLLKACILKVPGQNRRNEIVTDIPELQKISSQIPDCDGFNRCGAWDASKWECTE